MGNSIPRPASKAFRPLSQCPYGWPLGPSFIGRIIYWRVLIAMLWCLPVIGSFAQELPRKEIDLAAFVQDLFSVQDEDVNYEDLYESLFQLYTNPLNLNEANRDDLATLYVLSEAQINQFLLYRQQNGRLLSLYELQAIPGFDLATIYKLLPFVTVQNGNDGRTLWQRIATEPNHYLLMRYGQQIEQKKGFSAPDTNSSGSLNQRYVGSPGHWYARYRISHAKDFSFGITAEQDAGESFVWDPSTHRYGADFFSFHAQLQNRGRWKNLLVGDFQAQFGQGVVLSAGFSPGKGAETISTVRRSNLGVRPYSSVLETGFFRGATATYQLGRFELTGLYARNRRDANLLTQGDTLEVTEAYINSLLVSGFHRTPNEIRAKGAILEQNAGGNLLYRSRNQDLQLGLTWLSTFFDIRLERKPTQYNQFEFKGKSQGIASLSYGYNWRNFNLFGEWARSRSGGVGGVSGLVASLSPKVELAMVYRHYDRHFHSFYANAFSENTRNINESGMYWGLKMTPLKKITFSTYYDQFCFPWLRFGVDAPSQGYEYLLRLAYQPSKALLLYAQFREEEKGRNLSGGQNKVHLIADTRRRNYVLNVDYAALKWLGFRSRVQFSDYQQQAGPLTKGFVLLQDVNFDWGKWKLSTRVALFDTDDYNNRQYVYERDVLYSFSIPAYSDQGIRNYFLLQYQINRKIDLWLRWAKTSLRQTSTFSSGLEQINQPHRTDINAQVRYTF